MIGLVLGHDRLIILKILRIPINDGDIKKLSKKEIGGNMIKIF